MRLLIAESYARRLSGVPYDPDRIARFYDEYGEREWERFDTSAMDGVGLEVHLRLLGEHIRDGDLPRTQELTEAVKRHFRTLAQESLRRLVGEHSRTLAHPSAASPTWPASSRRIPCADER